MQNHQSSSDPKLLDIVSQIQQQIENLTARMVLMENRVSIVESKVMFLECLNLKGHMSFAITLYIVLNFLKNLLFEIT